MHNILSGVHVEGDVSFTGNLIGNVPGASISTEAYNSIKNNNGLYSSFGFEDIHANKITDHGTFSISEAQTFMGTILSTPKPNEITCDKWITDIPGEDNLTSSIVYIPTETGKYIICNGVPVDSNGNSGTQFFYFNDDMSVYIPIIVQNNPNDQCISWLTTDNQKTNYNQLMFTGRHKVQGVDQNELSLYNAPFSSIDPVVVYVQADLSQPQNNRPISQFVISNTGVYYRTGLQGNMPSSWINIASTLVKRDIVFPDSSGGNPSQVPYLGVSNGKTCSKIRVTLDAGKTLDINKPIIVNDSMFLTNAAHEKVSCSYIVKNITYTSFDVYALYDGIPANMLDSSFAEAEANFWPGSTNVISYSVQYYQF